MAEADSGSARDESLSAVVRRLASAQKGRGRGAPGYSVYVNRPIGRVLAALAYKAGLTPNGVTVISAIFTFTGIGLLAIAPMLPGVGIAVWILLALGYALDSADGQLARLRGGGSLSGEWLDHIIDSVKIVSLPLATAVALYRAETVDDVYLLVPLVFAIVATGTFFGMILNDLLKSARAVPTSAQRGGGGRLRSILTLPVDYGVLCIVYVLWSIPALFVPIYALFALAAVLYFLLAAVRWFREMQRIGRSDGTK